MKSEYKVQKSSNSRKRVCLALDLKDNPELIDKYKYYHSQENNWPEINEGIRNSGIQMMDIYLVDNRMFMICEVDESSDFDDCWNKMGTYPRQSEWGTLMAEFQQALPGHKLEWMKMERVYSLPEK